MEEIIENTAPTITDTSQIVFSLNALIGTVGTIVRGLGIVLLVYRLGLMVLSFGETHRIDATTNEIMQLVLAVVLIFMPQIASEIAQAVTSVL